MSKKNRIFLILFLSINLIYICFILISKIGDLNKNELPVIKMNENLITVKASASEDTLLNGLSAYDEEDGDLSDDIFIYNISSFDENNERVITYGVFDSSNQLVIASRKLKYSNYSAPKFSSTRSFINMNMSSDNFSFIHAKSVVDGDISNKISLTKSEVNDSIVYHFSVSDSTGTSSSFEIRDEINLNALYSNIDITLKKYLVYVHVGDDFDFYDNIKSISTNLGNYNHLKNDVDIETNYDSNKKGIYEARFTLNRSNGDYGISKMLIIVE